MRLLMGIATAILLAGCGDEGPPQPDMSLKVGDEGVISSASRMCNSVELYEIRRKIWQDVTQEELDTYNEALESGDCTSAYAKNLQYKVLDIGPVVEDATGCRLRYMVTIEVEEHGTRYVSSDRLPGTTQEQWDYRGNCTPRLSE